MKTRRRYMQGVGAGMTGALVSLAGCLGETGEKTQFAEMRDNEYDPKNTRAKEGELFAWENHDDVLHVVTSASDNWDMETEVQPDEVTSYEFSRSGVYRVVCSEHGDPESFTGMRMLIAVGDAELEDPLD